MRKLLFVSLLALIAGCEDGFGSTVGYYKPKPTLATTPPPPPVPVDNDKDDDGVTSEKDCDDGKASVGSARLWYADDDTDGFGTTNKTSKSCQKPNGYINNSADCDDGNSFVHPAAPEVCDNVDNDCNGVIDDSITKLWYHDGDGDGHGNFAKPFTDGCDGASFLSAIGDDCDDDDEDVHPGATEVCDKHDNDCDGMTDEDAVDAPTWYLDDDGDDYGKWDIFKQSCSEEDGYALKWGDCRDDVVSTHPDADEVCDGWDNDCDGKIDEDVQTAFYPDTDGDAYGDFLAAPTFACVAPENFAKTGDCDDKKKSVFPFAQEECDGADNDCDGQVDEAEPGVNLCEDNDPFTTDEVCDAATKGCLVKDVMFQFACELPKKFADAGGYQCGAAIFFDDFTDIDGYGSVLTIDDGTLEKSAVEVCAQLKDGHTLYVNSYVVEALGGDSAYEWVGGLYVTVSDSLTGDELEGTPGLVTILSPGLDFNYVLEDVPLCK